MILETPRLVLRPLEQSDAPDIQKHFPHWDIVKYLSKNAVRWPYPDDGAEKFLKNIALPLAEKGDDWFWGITRKQQPDEVIGVIHLRRNEASGNRGLWIAQEFQGAGYMKEALEAVNDTAFNVLGFERLVIKNAADNEASRQLKFKTGAEMLETRPASHYIGGSDTQEIWQLTPEKWNAFKLSRAFAQKAARLVYCVQEAFQWKRGTPAPKAAFTAAAKPCAAPAPFTGFYAGLLAGRAPKPAF